MATAGLLLSCACGPSAGSQSKGATEPGQPTQEDIEAQQVGAIASAVNEFSPAVHTCWARGAADDLKLEGRVVLRAVVGDGGTTRAVDVLEDVPEDDVLTECLVSLWSDAQWPVVFDPGSIIVLPPFEFVAPETQYTVAEAHVPTHERADGKLKARVILHEGNTGHKSAAVSVLSLSQGLAIPTHRHESVEMLYVRSGSGVLTDLAGRKTKVGPRTAIFIPAGTAHGFVQDGDEPTVALQFYAPAGAEQRFIDPTKTAGTTPVPAQELKKPPRRFARPFSKTVDSVPAQETDTAGWGIAVLYEGKGDGLSGPEMSLLSAAAGAVSPARRATRDTTWYLLQGEVAAVIGGREMMLQAGDALHLPVGTEVAFTVGQEALKAVQVRAAAAVAEPGPQENE